MLAPCMQGQKDLVENCIICVGRCAISAWTSWEFRKHVAQQAHQRLMMSFVLQVDASKANTESSCGSIQSNQLLTGTISHVLFRCRRSKSFMLITEGSLCDSCTHVLTATSVCCMRRRVAEHWVNVGHGGRKLNTSWISMLAICQCMFFLTPMQKQVLAVNRLCSHMMTPVQPILIFWLSF